MFEDIHPAAPTHLLVIPKKEIASVNNVNPEDEAILGHLFVVMRTVAAKLGIKDGYRVVTNCGRDGGQHVLHLHFHLLPAAGSAGRQGEAKGDEGVTVHRGLSPLRRAKGTGPCFRPTDPAKCRVRPKNGPVPSRPVSLFPTSASIRFAPINHDAG